ncbi:MAG: poly-gamma-glutamate hydrolase family protein [Chiayiivirga sp.]|jgi:phage replication-related protein YjqB (UPF0714/DUF867 family)|uniref:poly-gamma-glutamate hydrolase family protein n=1 Tax=Chiayiivirga sp. TaxID=2041042 RepID=UPI0025BE8C31|nr:poly-gamma-glutamate hydrolase family protein [Chiayiivirga sp.]MCI1728516.1 poly-gamma-glutamate hydrolase family protein [Chiayiivirga sp.]
MADRYGNFKELEAAESAGSYRIEHVSRASEFVLIAPHAGKIERGTSEICRAIAGKDCTYYLFEGCKPRNNQDLHITSARFDEPLGVSAAASGQIVVTTHGQAGDAEFVNVGGLATGLGTALISKLEAEGYIASRHANAGLQGLDTSNICNRGRSGQGVQLEISRGLRDKLVGSAAELERFATVIRSTLMANAGDNLGAKDAVPNR